jgi:hypothetical protein
MVDPMHPDDLSKLMRGFAEVFGRDESFDETERRIKEQRETERGAR